MRLDPDLHVLCVAGPRCAAGMAHAAWEAVHIAAQLLHVLACSCKPRFTTIGQLPNQHQGPDQKQFAFQNSPTLIQPAKSHASQIPLVVQCAAKPTVQQVHTCVC